MPTYTGYTVTEVNGNQVKISREKEITLGGIDKIMVVTGMVSYHPLEEKLAGKIPLYVIGDAKTVGKAQDTIRDGYATAKSL